MKRIFYFIVFALVSTFVFVSCKSAEQKKAEEYLQNQMKSPSSFKVISCELDLLEAYSTFDTIYHVKKIKGTKSSFSDDYISIDNVLIDSIKVTERQYPARHSYLIEYDAANSFGAILRDSKSIYVVNGECYDLETFVKIGKEIPYSAEAVNLTIKDPYGVFIKEGEWVYKWDLYGF